MPNHQRLRRVIPAVGLSAAILAGTTSGVGASSHREAPLMTEDPVADLTDVYAFVSPDNSSTVTMIMNVNPFQDPAGGPNFFKFGDEVKYRFNVDVNGDAKEDFAYNFRFSTRVKNGGTFLYNTGQVTTLDDADLNVVQTYSVTEEDMTRDRTTTMGKNLLVPPANVGVRSTPNYEANLGAAGVIPLVGGSKKVFAGPRDDPFFADLGKIFDLGSLGPFLPAHLIPSAAQPGEDYVAKKNVHTIALQVPIAHLTEAYGDPNIGVWATTYRRSTDVRRHNDDDSHRGKWVQVSRLGMPLVNEVVIPLGMKDKFNASQPRNDVQFAKSVLAPELASLFPVLYPVPGFTVPTTVNAGLGLGGREDIATIFLTGIPGVNKSSLFSTPAEMIRLNTSTPSMFPNGRLLTDDVIDVSLRALAGGIGFPGTEAFNKAPNNVLGDDVSVNDKPFLTRFPYVASPWSGTD
jgi:Domain of unknown function (DUF4331)